MRPTLHTRHDIPIDNAVNGLMPLHRSTLKPLANQSAEQLSLQDAALASPERSHYFITQQIGQPLLLKIDFGRAYTLSSHHSWDWSLAYQVHFHRANARQHNYKSRPFNLGKFSLNNPFEGISGIAQDLLSEEHNYSSFGAPQGSFTRPQTHLSANTHLWQIQIIHYRLGLYAGLYQRFYRQWQAGLRLGGLLSYNKINTQNGYSPKDNSIAYVPLHYSEVRISNPVKLNLNIEAVLGVRIHKHIELIGSLLYEYAPLWYNKLSDPKGIQPKLLNPSAYEYMQSSLQKLPIHDWHWSIGLRYSLI